MRKILVFSVIVFGLTVAAKWLWTAPISDLDQDQFDRGPASLSSVPHSPFVPTGRVGENVDVGTLLFEGVIHGKSLKMALLSGQIVRTGDRLGRYLITDIQPDDVTLSLGSNIYHLKLANYLPSVEKKQTLYTVEFRNASIKDALKFLSKAARLNLIMPEDVGGRVTVSFESIELMDAIRSILRVNGYEYAMEDKIIRVGRPDAFAGGTDLRTESFRLKYATSRDMVDKVKALLSDRGSVISDDRTNILTVKDRDTIVANISSLIDQVDRRDQQVQIEARIVDASRNFSRAIGIRWGLRGEKGDTVVQGTEDVGLNKDTDNPLNVNLGASNPTSGIGLIIGSITSALNLEAQLTAAEQKGDIQILSKPSVTTLNNMPAKIRSGTKIFVKSTSSISIGNTGGTGAQAGTSGLQEIDTGIELTVTPQISIDDFIKMKIEAIESEADFSRTVDGIPAVIDNTASTTVILKDGETTVIGGLYKQKITKEKRGVPGFQRIPVAGLLFQSRARTKADNELMIFVTPKIVGS